MLLSVTVTVPLLFSLSSSLKRWAMFYARFLANVNAPVLSKLLPLVWQLWQLIQKMNILLWVIAQSSWFGLHCRLKRQWHCYRPKAYRTSCHKEKVTRDRSPRVQVGCKWRIRLSLYTWHSFLVSNFEVETASETTKTSLCGSQMRFRRLATPLRSLVHWGYRVKAATPQSLVHLSHI